MLLRAINDSSGELYECRGTSATSLNKQPYADTFLMRQMFSGLLYLSVTSTAEVIPLVLTLIIFHILLLCDY